MVGLVSGWASVIRARTARCCRELTSRRNSLAGLLHDALVLPVLVMLLAACMLPTLQNLAAYWAPLQPLGATRGDFWALHGAIVARMDLGVPVFLCGAAALVLAGSRAWTWHRARRLVGVALLGSALLWAQIPLLRPVRRLAGAQAQRRAVPVIAALDRYTADHGEGPPSLQSLVPTYLPAMPGTGWACSPSFHYWPPRTTWLWRTDERYPRTRWVDFGTDDRVLRSKGRNELAQPGESPEAVLHRLGRPTETRFFPSWCLALPHDAVVSTYAVQPGQARAAAPWYHQRPPWDPCEWSTASPNAER